MEEEEGISTFPLPHDREKCCLLFQPQSPTEVCSAAAGDGAAPPTLAGREERGHSFWARGLLSGAHTWSELTWGAGVRGRGLLPALWRLFHERARGGSLGVLVATDGVHGVSERRSEACELTAPLPSQGSLH